MRGEREEVGENNGVRQDPFVPSFASFLSLGLLPPFRGSFERGREIERDVRYRLPLLLFPLLPSPLHIHGGANLGLEVDLAPLCAATFIAVDVQPRADHARRSHHGSSARIAARLVSHQGRRRRRRRRLDGNVGRHEAKPLHARAASARPSRVVRPVDGYVTRAVLG